MLQPIEFKELRHPQGYPETIETLGDHLLAARLSRGLRQRDVAKEIGVCAETILGWEKNRHLPDARHYPNLMTFLGYCPIEKVSSYGDQIRVTRLHKGLSQKAAARLLRIDPVTLRRIENGSLLYPSKAVRQKCGAIFSEAFDH